MVQLLPLRRRVTMATIENHIQELILLISELPELYTSSPAVNINISEEKQS